MKGQLQSFGFSVARILLAFSVVVLAVFLIPLLLEGYFMLTSSATSDHERKMTFFLAKAVAICGLIGTLSFLLMRRWRPHSLRLQPVKSARTMQGIRIFSYTVWSILIVTNCLMNLPGPWFERVGWTFVTLALLLAGAHVCVVTHELGHFLAARIAGLEPFHFRIGVGPVLWRLVGSSGLLVEWRLLPAGGIVKAWRRDGGFHRGHHWFMVAAGPVASLALSLLLWRLFPSWPSHGHAAWPYAAERAGFALLIWNSFLLLTSVVPQRVVFDGKQYQSDGLHLVTLLRRPKFTPAEMAKEIHLQRLGFLWETSQRPRAWATLREVEGSMPEPPAWLDLPRGLFACEEGDYALASEALARCLADPELAAHLRPLVLCQLGLARAGLGETRAARLHCVRLLRSVPREARAAWLDHCASIPALTGRPEMLPFAQRWMKHALRREPANLVYQITQATLWFEQGDAPRAEAAMRKFVRSKVDVQNRGASAFYLALALQKRGAPVEEVAKWRASALRWCAQLWLHRRVAAELPEGGDARATMVGLAGGEKAA